MGTLRPSSEGKTVTLDSDASFGRIASRQIEKNFVKNDSSIHRKFLTSCYRGGSHCRVEIQPFTPVPGASRGGGVHPRDTAAQGGIARNDDGSLIQRQRRTETWKIEPCGFPSESKSVKIKSS
jgi:hypothetical protein